MSIFKPKYITFDCYGTLTRFQMNRPFPQFSGDLTQLGRNDSQICYNSVQISYNLRMRGGLTFTGAEAHAICSYRIRWS